MKPAVAWLALVSVCLLTLGARIAAGRPRVTLTEGRIEVLEKVRFEPRGAVVLPASNALLDEVVTSLKSRPKMRLRIEVHTEARGDVNQNRALSLARAESVKAYLVGHGVAGNRLETKGYGGDRPLTTAASDEADDKNRRVEFSIIR